MEDVFVPNIRMRGIENFFSRDGLSWSMGTSIRAPFFYQFYAEFGGLVTLHSTVWLLMFPHFCHFTIVLDDIGCWFDNHREVEAWQGLTIIIHKNMIEIYET